MFRMIKRLLIVIKHLEWVYPWVDAQIEQLLDTLQRLFVQMVQRDNTKNLLSTTFNAKELERK